MIKIGLVGGSGRMGKLISECIQERDDLCLSSLYQRGGHGSQVQGLYMGTDWREFLEHSEVVIDFSSPQLSPVLFEALEKNPKPLMIGTTGLSQESREKLKQLSHKVPIVYASNTSQGVNLLNRLAFLAAKLLRDADIEILEMHHRNKKDAPSGTAITLAEHCARARDLDLESVRVSGRDGSHCKRKEGEIGVMSLRGGDIVGRHTVGFYCEGEYLELTHAATDRKTFALGAIKAAAWLYSRANGLYSMEDVLGQ